MLVPLALNFAGLLLLYVYFLLERVRLERLRHRTAEVRLKRGRRGMSPAQQTQQTQQTQWTQ
jgi:hypothetical protein